REDIDDSLGLAGVVLTALEFHPEGVIARITQLEGERVRGKLAFDVEAEEPEHFFGGQSFRWSDTEGCRAREPVVLTEHPQRHLGSDVAKLSVGLSSDGRETSRVGL